MTTSRMSRPRARRLAAAALIVALFCALRAPSGAAWSPPRRRAPPPTRTWSSTPCCTRACATGRSARTAAARVTAISGVRQQPCTFYMGATGGGVWKTTDCGAVWEPVSDGQIETGSIGAIAVAESNPDIVWVGTGSAAIRSNVIIGRGVYKSMDAGRTWTLVGLRDGGQIGSVVDPSRPTPTSCGWPRSARRSARPTCAASTRPPTAARRGRARCS